MESRARETIITGFDAEAGANRYAARRACARLLASLLIEGDASLSRDGRGG
jgi:hypothetical protein